MGPKDPFDLYRNWPSASCSKSQSGPKDLIDEEQAALRAACVVRTTGLRPVVLLAREDQLQLAISLLNQQKSTLVSSSAAHEGGFSVDLTVIFPSIALAFGQRTT